MTFFLLRQKINTLMIQKRISVLFFDIEDSLIRIIELSKVACTYVCWNRTFKTNKKIIFFIYLSSENVL